METAMQIQRTTSVEATRAALPLLANLDALYPGFAGWYADKVVPGVAKGQDVVLLAFDEDQLAGIALGKRSATETKLRCVRVVPRLQQTGAGLRLIDRMLEELECETPHCTVAEELLHSYSRAFVNRYGFQLSDVTKGEYRRGRLEYHFN